MVLSCANSYALAKHEDEIEKREKQTEIMKAEISEMYEEALNDIKFEFDRIVEKYELVYTFDEYVKEFVS